MCHPEGVLSQDIHGQMKDGEYDVSGWTAIETMQGYDKCKV